MRRSRVPATMDAVVFQPHISLDALVQGSMVELFAAYNVALAPLLASRANSEPVPDVSIGVGFAHAGKVDRGRLTLSLSTVLLDHMQRSENTSVRVDWARELTNQLIGAIKNRLLTFGVTLEVGIPSLIAARSLERDSGAGNGLRTYAARSMRGLVLVTLRGVPEDSKLAYVGYMTHPEGSVIWL